MTLLEVIKKLNTNANCLNFIANVRWPKGIRCPRCDGKKIFRIPVRHKYECSECEYQYNATAGTILAKTYIPLSKWMLAIYLFCCYSGRMRPAEIARVLDLPYKTGWHLHNKIKKNSKNFEFDQLAGLV